MQLCCAVCAKVLEGLPAGPGGLDLINITLMVAQDPTATSVDAVRAL